MKVLYKEPGKGLVTKEIEGDLKTLQNLVGGFIEILTLGHDVLMICNEEGKLKGLEINFCIAHDVIVGPVIFCSKSGSDIASIEDEQINWIFFLFSKGLFDEY